MNAHYIAGLFDGEGSIGVYRHSGKTSGPMLRTQLTQNIHKESVKLFQELQGYFGGNLLTNKTRSGKKRHNWQLTNEKALKFLKWLLPSLRFKKEEAELAIQWQLTKPGPTRNKRTGHFNPYPYRKYDHFVMKTLKKMKGLK